MTTGHRGLQGERGMGWYPQCSSRSLLLVCSVCLLVLACASQILLPVESGKLQAGKAIVVGRFRATDTRWTWSAESSDFTADLRYYQDAWLPDYYLTTADYWRHLSTQTGLPRPDRSRYVRLAHFDPSGPHSDYNSTFSVAAAVAPGTYVVVADFSRCPVAVKKQTGSTSWSSNVTLGRRAILKLEAPAGAIANFGRVTLQFGREGSTGWDWDLKSNDYARHLGVVLHVGRDPEIVGFGADQFGYRYVYQCVFERDADTTALSMLLAKHTGLRESVVVGVSDDR